jgi:hypothetical protein
LPVDYMQAFGIGEGRTGDADDDIMLCCYYGGVPRFNFGKFAHFCVLKGKILCLMRRKDFSTRQWVCVFIPPVYITAIEGSAHARQFITVQGPSALYDLFGMTHVHSLKAVAMQTLLLGMVVYTSYIQSM